MTVNKKAPRGKAARGKLFAGQAAIIRSIIRICLLLTAGAITVLSLLPKLPPSTLDIPYLDKLEHALAYAVLGFLCLLSFPVRVNAWAAFFITIAACTLYGGLLEGLQTLMHRSAELADLLADLTGAALGAFCGRVAAKYTQNEVN